MSRPDPSEILTAIVTLLLAETDITDLVGTRVYNHTPQDQRTFPYLRVRVSRVTQDDSKTSCGLDCDIIVEVWSDHDGDKEALNISAVVDRVLDMQPLVLTGGQQVVFHQFVDAAANESSEDLPRSVFQTYHLKASD